MAGEAAETARRILQLREQHRAAITEHLGRAAGNGHKVLESLFDHPIVAVSDVQKLTGTTYAASNTLVSRLAQGSPCEVAEPDGVGSAYHAALAAIDRTTL